MKLVSNERCMLKPSQHIIQMKLGNEWLSTSIQTVAAEGSPFLDYQTTSNFSTTLVTSNLKGLMASSTTFSISTLIDGKLPCRQSASPQCVSLPTLPPPPVQSHTRSPWKTTSFCRKIARNVMSMASSSTTTEETTASVDDVAAASSPEQLSVSDDSPEFLKTVQQAWEKVEDKYAVSTLAVAGTVALWGTAGVISAIDRLPLIPGVLEVVGIGYTGWFAYKNLVFKPDREALVQKVKDTFKEITGIDS